MIKHKTEINQISLPLLNSCLASIINFFCHCVNPMLEERQQMFVFWRQSVAEDMHLNVFLLG